MDDSLDLAELREAAEVELKGIIYGGIPAEYGGMCPQLAYHMGWEGEQAGPEAEGKRIRPLLVLLCTLAGGGDWRKALPAAAAVELIHNFSLIHDDIQDQSPLRRGRKTVWVKWGVAQAINAGDLMYTLAFHALQKLRKHLTAEIALEAHQILDSTCVLLTGGQYLDLSYEQARTISLEAYWSMIGGKTAALLACCAELGALAAGIDLAHRQAFRDFGYQLGLAFQVQDDWLGIWGDAARTGKSVESDLVSGKKSLPVVYALQQNREFARRWLAGPIQPEEVGLLARLLEDEGAREFTSGHAARLTRLALAALDQAAVDPQGKRLLLSMAQSLLKREF